MTDEAYDVILPRAFFFLVFWLVGAAAVVKNTVKLHKITISEFPDFIQLHRRFKLTNNN